MIAYLIVAVVALVGGGYLGYRYGRYIETKVLDEIIADIAEDQ